MGATAITAISFLWNKKLSWRRRPLAAILTLVCSLADLHVLLLEDLLILLQKQDDKYVLKCLSTTVIAGYQDTKVILLFLSLSTLSVSSFLIGSHNQLTCSVTLYGNSLRLSEFGLCGCFFSPQTTHSPIIKLNGVLARNVATGVSISFAFLLCILLFCCII